VGFLTECTKNMNSHKPCGIDAIHFLEFVLLLRYKYIWPIPVAARSKAWVGGRSLVGDCGFGSRRRLGCLSLVSVVCCQVEVAAMGLSLDQKSPADCGVSLCVIVKPQYWEALAHWGGGAVASW
jgi:hypothetical protein